MRIPISYYETEADMEIVRSINYLLSLIFLICYSYQFVYIIISLFLKKKSYAESSTKRYGVLICARNEENVVSQLIFSIKNQNYPAELIDVFLVADNCSDNTADTARNSGAIVFERNNRQKIGKGYALNYLLCRIDEQYKIESYAGFFVFDADNLLDESYIGEMNKAFSHGYDIVTSYRNSKNYDSNWISAGYSLWFLRESCSLNHPRCVLKTSCAVSGTGFLFATGLIKKYGGWHFFLLTEDIEFTVHNILNNEKIGYCATAVLYDEQPVTFKQSWHQRIRWAKGYLQVFSKYGYSMIKGVFKKSGFSCYDMCMSTMPAVFISIAGMIINITALIAGSINNIDVSLIISSLLEAFVNMYLMLFVIGGITTITQWDMIHAKPISKIIYIFTFPLFMMTYIPISIVALFKKVEWKPIAHTYSATLSQVRIKK
jgi:cellulose synthase/poly-beta-1,6-N-acetylglucosamine synthase-like glycosyltransferase